MSTGLGSCTYCAYSDCRNRCFAGRLMIASVFWKRLSLITFTLLLGVFARSLESYGDEQRGRGVGRRPVTLPPLSIPPQAPLTPCDTKCKTVYIDCEAPPTPAPLVDEPIPVAPLAESLKFDFMTRPSRDAFRESSLTRQSFPCPNSMCVTRSSDSKGSCTLHLGDGLAITAYARQPAGQNRSALGQFRPGHERLVCGNTLTVNEMRDSIDGLRSFLRNYLPTLVPNALKNPDLENSRRALFTRLAVLILNTCGLADELQHILGLDNCTALSCHEFNSADSSLNCFKSSITRNTIQSLINLFPEFKADVMNWFCQQAAYVSIATQVEGCICIHHRPGKLTDENCKQCVDTFCNKPPFTSPYGFKDPLLGALGLFCASSLDDQVKKHISDSCLRGYMDPSAATHACPAYLKRPSPVVPNT